MALSEVQSDWLSEFPPPRSIPLDQEALRIYERAYYIGLSGEAPTDPPITFSTVVLALLTGEDETSRWFRSLAASNGPLPEKVSAGGGMTFARASAASYPTGKPEHVRLSSDNQLLTVSARSVISTAEEWANRVGGSDIGVRHLVAAYVLNPPAAHRSQMHGWGFKETEWRSAFFKWVAERYTAESWKDAENKLAPTRAVPTFESVEVKGRALAFPGDRQANAVLARAADYHGRGSDRWLRLQTVIFALVDEADADEALRAEIEPIWTAMQAAKQAFQKAFADYTRGAAQRAVASFDDVDISPRVLNALETARELARTTLLNKGIVGVLELAGALVSRRIDGDDDLVQQGFDPQDLRTELIAHAVKRGEPAEIWREALGEEETAPPGRAVALNSDDPEAVVRSDATWATDPLGIRPDVMSFAALLSSTSLEPPLSLGLFGPWGSGKTTFLKRLRLAIDERTTAARETLKAGKPSPFVSNVVHVEFNAWHFAEEAIVSSLVETIIRELRAFIKDDYPKIGAALAAMKSAAAIGAAAMVAEAKAKEAQARDVVATAEREVLEKEKAARQGAASVRSAVSTAFASLVKSDAIQKNPVMKGLAESASSFEELQARMASVRSRPARILQDLGWKWTAMFAAAVLILPAFLAWGVSELLKTGEIVQALTSVGAVLSVIALWVRSASQAVTKVDKALADVAAAYEKAVRESPQVVRAEAQLQAATQALAEASDSLSSAQTDLRKAEADAAAVSLPAQMLTVVSGRIDDMTYAKELTTVSTARGDLQMLSRLLREQASAGAASADLRAVDRIVLYIDDLDRCRPQDVVRVLQVVHMLLTFELFVVVVAVDARWVEESLKQSYRWLADGNLAENGAERTVPDPEVGVGGAGITPQDYLEKIFQISFWLEPMTAARSAAYLKSLVRPVRNDPGSASSPTEGVGRIEILPIELDYMRALSAYVGPSPRRVKRLVNAYRLLKARLSDAQLHSFITDRSTEEGGPRSGPYQLVIGLLVIGTGMPGSATQILRDLADRDPRDGWDALVKSFRERKQYDWTIAAQVLETLMRTQKPKDVSELRGWARRVGRFLLRGPAEFLGQRSTGGADAVQPAPGD